jgi:uncharacterized membrane protein YqaE (UPF0057 family)
MGRNMSAIFISMASLGTVDIIMELLLFALFYLGGAYFIIYAFWKELNKR